MNPQKGNTAAFGMGLFNGPPKKTAHLTSILRKSITGYTEDAQGAQKI